MYNTTVVELAGVIELPPTKFSYATLLTVQHRRLQVLQAFLASCASRRPSESPTRPLWGLFQHKILQWITKLQHVPVDLQSVVTLDPAPANPMKSHEALRSVVQTLHYTLSGFVRYKQMVGALAVPVTAVAAVWWR